MALSCGRALPARCALAKRLASSASVGPALGQATNQSMAISRMAIRWRVDAAITAPTCNGIPRRLSTGRLPGPCQNGLGHEHRCPLDRGRLVVMAAALKLISSVLFTHQLGPAEHRHHAAGVQHDSPAFFATLLHAALLPACSVSARASSIRMRSNHQSATSALALRRGLLRLLRLPRRLPPMRLPSGSSIWARGLVNCLSVVFIVPCITVWQ